MFAWRSSVNWKGRMMKGSHKKSFFVLLQLMSSKKLGLVKITPAINKMFSKERAGLHSLSCLRAFQPETSGVASQNIPWCSNCRGKYLHSFWLIFFFQDHIQIHSYDSFSVTLPVTHHLEPESHQPPLFNYFNPVNGLKLAHCKALSLPENRVSLMKLI